MKVLLTGFEPFGGLRSNSSERLVSSFPECLDRSFFDDELSYFGEVEIVKSILPVTLEGAVSSIEEAVLKERPDVVLCVGQAGGRTDISVEMLGINVCDFMIPDNNGTRCIGEMISADGREAFFTTIPCREIVSTLNEEGIPASLSYSAGTYICNYTVYRVGEILQKYSNIRFGFLHIPYLPEQVAELYREGGKQNLPSMSLSLLKQALGIVLKQCF